MDTPPHSDHAGDVNASEHVLERLRRRTRTPAAELFRRVFVINGLVFTLGTLVLALSPATVSARIRLTEIPVLVVGLAVILAANALLLRSSLAPLDELASSMRRVNPPHRGDRVDDRGKGDLHHLIASFNAMLDRQEGERTSASASALAAQENERQRIARELHDEIGQSLTVVLLTLKRAVDRAPAELCADLHEAQETVRASLDEVQSIARRLRPDALEVLGLHSALNALCNEFTHATGITVAKHTAPQLVRLDPDVELVCYRVAQESLTNIARHAEAEKVWLDVHATAEQLTLRIADDGRGGVATDGAGIRGMRERALLVDAALTITSSGESGTEVRMTIPLSTVRSPQ
ncbi:MAG: histidine kinase [Mycobacterium sp.]